MRYNKIKKAILMIVLALLTVMLSGCVPTVTKESPEKVSRFVQIERTGPYLVVYDNETKVMYAVSYYGSGSGVFTLLVNADGTPKLWEE